MSRLDDQLENFLETLKGKGVLRDLKPGNPDGAAHVWRDGQKLINFSSNNYLGLTQHPKLIERAVAWTEKWGTGSGASRLVTGTFEAHTMVEEKLAGLKGTESALIFNSGFQANGAVLPALFDKEMLGRDAIVFTDRLIHASLHQGCRAAGVHEIRFRHNDLPHLESLLEKYDQDGGRKFILTESVFSMDGDRADLEGLCDLADKFDAFLYVDEAHATGVLGPQGMGLSGDVLGRVDLVMGTFSKALGSFGGYVACSERLKDYLINRAGGFIYSTSLPPGVLGAMDAALDLVPEMDAERSKLHRHAGRLRDALSAHGLDTCNSSTQIVPAVLGGVAETLNAASILEDAGILGIAIRPPTVAKDTARIRFALSAEHRDEDVEKLLAMIPNIAALKKRGAA
ncbi:MAG: 8-amino-7-oxononanoate synthase [Rhodospirillaceae bacterium]|jgi:8-amino-7-oxononanoate synthase|nr:8-amino-7-oxononanoate synthase [Rhodospirillales bacterium]MBT3906204.1 8-amino-7-oxononanoate synthase [Rhodospirillaceae bacterium]MBT4702004.1 8-amino-7-oxononanoate synthase [Rhodospirillaceae bacterium]MBT5034720.1 8-amino-7-oxononanoate synthase [Rhodospirillaceae bacterium]MBT6221479.1 8-amino-7-oxononanoate synthase [Rhodospirillaceae bacterium]